ncbi:acyltransferase [Pseudomonas sp. GV071]|jgi:peptidoglycan/LPS O-acetylase OafA/YrhL|uniref:acyltransferase family protein n=1 Tax=Pseudomonas sp. GV071 TaxID=2135754 RepID=UPI000D37CC08|nr:acyltransferase [Pseudomonas sp. GV071]PTQ70663.1 peptidoglycan/LPS O-acetylase OafA/YrhL [Pseudomonas sp. GV071]
MTASIPKRFYSLDLIRGLAALAVVFWHWQHFFYAGSTFMPYEMEAQPFYSVFYLLYHTGWLAVDFFFSLSGFIFFWLYAEQIAERKVSAWQFFALRFSRLYPLHFATLVFVLLAQKWVMASTGDYFVVPFNDTYHFVLNLFMASSWGLEQGPSFNGPVWSVSVEVLMYLLFFTVCLLFRLRLQAVLAMIVVGLLVLTVAPILGRGIFSFFLGGAIFRFYRYLCQQGLLNKALPIVLGLTGALWLATLVEVKTGWLWGHVQLLLEGLLPAHLHPLIGKAIHAASRFIPVALLFPLTILSLALAETWRGYLGRRFAMVGNLTYSSYLLHFPLQLVVFEVTRYMGIANSFFYHPLSMIMFFVLLIPICLLSYYYFETPAQKHVRAFMLNAANKQKTVAGTQNG